MTGEGLALVSALCFGVTDILAGLLARRADGARVALYGQAAGTVLMLGAALAVAAPDVTAADVGWGALSGVGTGLGAALLFRAMAVGRFSVVVPLSVVTGIALPVLAGVALLGERPGPVAWTGIAAALPALWLTTRSPDANGERTGGAAAGTALALAAGVGFALQYGALTQADAAAGLWPLAANRAVSVLAILPLVLARGSGFRLPRRTALGSAGTGVVSMAAITAYALAGRTQDLSLVSVLASMYPVVPVVWGVAALRERVGRAQTTGLLCTGASITLLAVG
jgi:drug/metabolite transporter (DMT)-like permease